MELKLCVKGKMREKTCVVCLFENQKIKMSQIVLKVYPEVSENFLSTTTK